MINFIDKAGLYEAIEAAGHTLHQEDNVWIPSDEAAVQLIIDNHDELPLLKSTKIAELKKEGLARVNLTFPAVTNFDELDLIKEQFLSVAPAARSPTVDFQKMIDIVQVGKDAVTSINALTVANDIKNYDVMNTPNWPV